MNNYNRNKDLTQVFDERWRVNNAVNTNQIHRRDTEMNNRMNNRNVFQKEMDTSVKGRVNNLQERMNSQNNINNMIRQNNFKNNIGR